MDPVNLVMGLANVVPSVMYWLGQDNAGASAEKIINIAKQVSGESQPDVAVSAIRQNPTLALQFQQSITRHQELLAQFKNSQTQCTMKSANTLGEVNQMIHAQCQSAHWLSYSWRPFIGFCFGATALLSAVTLTFCYIAVVFFQVDSKALAQLPLIIGAETAIMATMSPILGIASWFRGKMQAGPKAQSPKGG